jgi:hypothetical protein
MEGLINHKNKGLLKELALMPNSCNTLWGTEYILLDSLGFMGRTDGGRYDTVIDMFVKIRERRKRGH